MKKESWFCDRCNKETKTSNIASIKVEYLFEEFSTYPEIKLEICRDCVKDLKTFLKGVSK